MTIAAFIVGLAGAVFALLAWLTARQRQPFILKRDGNLVLLTRARRPSVQIRRVFVFGHSQLVTADRASTTEWRALGRDEQLVLSIGASVGGDLVAPVDPSETVTVQYRRIWPWDIDANQGRPNWFRKEPGESKDKREIRREKLDSNHKIWTEWRSSLL